MFRSSLQASSVVLVVLAVTSASCSCNNKPVVPTDQGQCGDITGVQTDHPEPCTASTECADHFSCTAVKGKEGLSCCVAADRACVTEADCCPGQTCPIERKKCFDKFDPTGKACQTDSDCGDRGDRVCDAYSDTYGLSPRCRLKPCGPNNECAEGQNCFQGECIAGLPCEGHCESGKACVPSVGFCQDYTATTGRPAAACPMTCSPGFIATFKNTRNIWDSCTLKDVACVCAELPGLTSHDLGRFSALAADPGKALFVSTYDGQFGDLVVVKYGLDGKKLATEYVDGVPSATAKYGPSGARGGVEEPGPDVGRYTDIAVNQGRVYVSYFDVTQADLKVAVRDPQGQWTNHTVDGSQAQLGLYTSIALDSQGRPGVSYFQRAADATFNVADCPAPRPTAAPKYITALKFARATSATPTSASDWQVKTIACLARTAHPCDDCNGVCADPGTGPACLTAAPSGSCTADGGKACDSSAETCVTVNTSSLCATNVTPTELQIVPPGVGVFTSLVFKGDDAFIAYMQRTGPAIGAKDGNLYGVTVSGGGAAGTPVLLDESGDTGYFPDLKFDPASGYFGIGYHDFTSKAFKFYAATSFQPGVVPEIIDPGSDLSGLGNQSWVGTDSSIVVGPAGKVWALYQDPTRGDLKLARRTTTWAVQPSPRTEGAVGFFADGIFTDGKVYASHARLHATVSHDQATIDNSLLLEVLSGD